MGCGCKNKKKQEEAVVENVVVEKPIETVENGTTDKENKSGEVISE